MLGATDRQTPCVAVCDVVTNHDLTLARSDCDDACALFRMNDVIE